MIKFLRALTLTIVSSIIVPRPIHAQFAEDFSDGDFTANPRWSGQETDFVISDGGLRLSAPAEPGYAYLTTPSQAMEMAVWELSVKLEFNPSDANYARIYLCSDQNVLDSGTNGYYVLVGSRLDEVSLYRQEGDEHFKIIDGMDGITDSSLNHLRIKATRDRDGGWKLFTAAGTGGDYRLEGEVVDTTFPTSSYVGIYCEFTSTRSRKFLFDDIQVVGEPAADRNDDPVFKDVIITEILADPDPPVLLPELEFVELLNRSGRDMNLAAWKISDTRTSSRLPAVTLAAGEYLVLISENQANPFDPLVHVAQVPGLPSLNNDGDVVVLKSVSGNTIDSVNYTQDWYRNGEKSAGGWTLELIDPQNTCGEEDNWTVSTDASGGTPGRRNSVYANKPDLTGPELSQAIAITSKHLRLYFNEKLADERVNGSDISIDPPVLIDSVYFTDGALRSIDLMLGTALEARTVYTVAVRRIRDCSTNAINPERSTGKFAVSESADSTDVVINEILFDPLPPGVDFVELYNRSPKFLDLKNWIIGEYENGVVHLTRRITSDHLIMHPNSFLVLSADPDAVIGQYPTSAPDVFIKTLIPPLPDNGGSVAIMDSANRIIDAMVYNQVFHSPFIKDSEGVSLERVSSTASTTDPANWHSASSNSGYATPGRINSNAYPEPMIPYNEVKVEPPVFRPVYGQPNFTQVYYKFEKQGYVANAKIFDAMGRTIKVIANNDVLGSEGFYRWDGDRDDGTKARVGSYWLWFEVFSLSGTVQTFRKQVVVAGEF